MGAQRPWPTWSESTLITLDMRFLGIVIAIFKMWICPFTQTCIRHLMTKLNQHKKYVSLIFITCHSDVFWIFLENPANIPVIQNNMMQIIHVIRTLKIVCDFLDMEDGCYLIFNKYQHMFAVRISIYAQIKMISYCFFFVTIKSELVKPLFLPS